MALQTVRCDTTGVDSDNQQELTTTYKISIDKNDSKCMLDPALILSDPDGGSGVSSVYQIPVRGSRYSIAGVCEPTGTKLPTGMSQLNWDSMICVSRTPGAIYYDSGRYVRDVSVSFEYPGQDNQRGRRGVQPVGEYSVNPFDWKTQIEIDGQVISQPVQHFPFLGAWKATKNDNVANMLDRCGSVQPTLTTTVAVPAAGVDWEAGNWAGLTTTAGQFHPARDIGLVDVSINITKYFPVNHTVGGQPWSVFNTYCYQNTLNKTNVVFQLDYLGINITFAPTEFFLRKIRATPQYREIPNGTGGVNQLWYWRVDYECFYRPGGFYFELANAGTLRLTSGGSIDDGHGGTLPADQDGEAIQDPIIGKTGFPIDQEVPLDLTGQPTKDQWFTRWRERFWSEHNDAKVALFPMQ